MIRRLASLLAAASLALVLAGCSTAGTTNHATVDLGSSSTYTQADRQAAADAVIAQFQTLKGCDLRAIKYSAELTQTECGTNTNCVAFLSDFHVGASGSDGSLNPNSDYTWSWQLTRTASGAPWVVVTRGVA